MLTSVSSQKFFKLNVYFVGTVSEELMHIKIDESKFTSNLTHFVHYQYLTFSSFFPFFVKCFHPRMKQTTSLKSDRDRVYWREEKSRFFQSSIDWDHLFPHTSFWRFFNATKVVWWLHKSQGLKNELSSILEASPNQTIKEKACEIY